MRERGTQLNHARGLSVALLGPDGAGKSTLATHLQGIFGSQVRCMYLGLGNPSANRGGRRRLELGLSGHLLRFWGCCLSGQWYRARGQIVLFDRHPCEARLPARRQLRWYMHVSRWVRAHACPTPDLVFVLDAPGRLMHQRKGEHTPEQLEVERQDFLALQERMAQLRVLDATRPAEAVAAEAATFISRHSGGRG
jgi:thymidylate kinase